jgi:hypothetical protein
MANQPFNFITPFSLEHCKRRLMYRHEKSTLWAWRGQTRLELQTWDVDYQSVGFRLRRVAKSSLELNLGTPVNLVGLLERLSGEQTSVTAEVKINYSRYAADVGGIC